MKKSIIFVNDIICIPFIVSMYQTLELKKNGVKKEYFCPLFFVRSPDSMLHVSIKRITAKLICIKLYIAFIASKINHSTESAINSMQFRFSRDE